MTDPIVGKTPEGDSIYQNEKGEKYILADVRKEEEIRKKEAIERRRKELEEAKKMAEMSKEDLQKAIKSEIKQSKEDDQFSNELKTTFQNIATIGAKVEDLHKKQDEKFRGLETKQNEMCTGVDCIKEDINSLKKEIDTMKGNIIPCPNCGTDIRELSSYCPNCGHPIYEWDDLQTGEPTKNWKPYWDRPGSHVFVVPKE